MGVFLLRISGHDIELIWIVFAALSWVVDEFLRLWLPGQKSYIKMIAWGWRMYYRILYGAIAQKARKTYIKKNQ